VRPKFRDLRDLSQVDVISADELGYLETIEVVGRGVVDGERCRCGCSPKICESDNEKAGAEQRGC